VIKDEYQKPTASIKDLMQAVFEEKPVAQLVKKHSTFTKPGISLLC
jgi:hypothetical protein